MARANRRATAIDDQIRGRPPKTFNPLNRRWVIGHDGTIYHYGYFDPRHEVLTSLTMYRLTPNAWTTGVANLRRDAPSSAGGWTAVKGWSQDFTVRAAEVAIVRPRAASDRGARILQDGRYGSRPDERGAAAPVGGRTRRNRRQRRSAVEVDLQRKLAFPFVTFVMTLLAVPFGVTTGRRGALYGIGLGIVLALSYWFVMSVFVAVGKAGLLPPILAAWTPNIIVSASAIYLLLTAKT